MIAADAFGKIYLTMDIDWASDEVLDNALDLFQELQMPVTIFVTHDTPLLSRMRQDPLIRLGIHPNFYPQLQNRAEEDYLAVIQKLHALVPEAVSARSHGLVDATPLLLAFKNVGITRDLNLFLPYSAKLKNRPFRHFSGLLRVPFFYEDDAYCFEPHKFSPEEHVLAAPDCLRVFNFHPIHLFLNTESMDRYEKAKVLQRDFQRLKEFINPDQMAGARSFLKRVAACAKDHQIAFDHVENI